MTPPNSHGHAAPRVRCPATYEHARLARQAIHTTLCNYEVSHLDDLDRVADSYAAYTAEIYLYAALCMEQVSAALDADTLDCGQVRYRLLRQWDEAGHSVMRALVVFHEIFVRLQAIGRDDLLTLKSASVGA